MKLLAKAMLEQNLTFQWAERSLRFATNRHQEPELGLLSFIVDPNRIAIDVGAHAGVYTHTLLMLGANVVAIEANPALAQNLRRLYGRRAQILQVAASSSKGTAKLRMPKGAAARSNGIATIEGANRLHCADVDELDVSTIALDDLELGAVGFMKVDVEGHEYEVLLGAKQILERDHPSLLIEAEERHRPGAIKSINELLIPLGYQGFMLVEGKLSSIAGFRAERDQHIPDHATADLNAGQYKGRYINNFLFTA